jgi:hypothetical protein
MDGSAGCRWPKLSWQSSGCEAGSREIPLSTRQPAPMTHWFGFRSLASMMNMRNHEYRDDLVHNSGGSTGGGTATPRSRGAQLRGRGRA